LLIDSLEQYLPLISESERQNLVQKTIDYKLIRLEGYFRDPRIPKEGLLGTGHSGEACRNIRIALQYLGYSIPESDKYDKELEGMVRDFQVDNNHTSNDGCVGPNTRKLLAQKLREKIGERPFHKMKYPEGEAFPFVFLSYARDDLDSARRIFQELTRAGVRVWFDKESLLPGQNWSGAVRKGIRGSRFFLALLSEKSVSKAGYVQKEIKMALEMLDEFPESSIFLIPVRLNVCDPTHGRINEIQWVDMFPVWHIGLARILKTLADQT